VVTRRTDPTLIDLGRRSGGGRFTVPAPGHGLLHVLNSGKTNSGKSSTAAKLIGSLAGRADVVLVGDDHKAGMELLPWAPRFTEIATTIAHTEDLLGRQVEQIDARGQLILEHSERLGHTIRSWQPWMGPRFVHVVDEAAELTASRTAIELLDSLAARGRALGVHLIVSTQYALTSDFPTTLLLNLTGRICHRMGTAAQYATALAVDQAELRDHGFEPIPEGGRYQGVCYVNGIPGLADLSRCRTDLVSDDAIDRRVAATAHLRRSPEQAFQIAHSSGGGEELDAEAVGDPQGSRRSEANTEPPATEPTGRSVIFGGLTS
jgi:DNA segregation ATPase FtsK/SpoIIIE-like protein